MEKKDYKDEVCVYCGKEYEVTYYTDDGFDFDGHKRGSTSTRKEGKCNCEAEQLLEKLKIKKMCINCAYYDVGYCQNQKTINELRESMEAFDFGMRKNILIKHKEKKCKNYKFNTQLIKDIFIN